MKGISLLLSNFLKPLLNESVKRLITINVLIFFALLILFNSILIISVNFIHRENIDNRIEHEIDNIVKRISFNDKTIEIDSTFIYESHFYSQTDIPSFIQIYNSSNQILFSGKSSYLYEKINAPTYFNLSSTHYESFSCDNKTYRAAYYPIKNKQGEQIAILRIIVFDKIKSILFNNLILFNLIAIPIALILLFFFSLLNSKIVFKPLNNIIDVVQKISQNNLSERINIKAHPDDELGKLRDTLNNLFDKIENYINEQKHFTDQVSHQLMNPLTAIKTEIEYILKNERENKIYKDALLRLEVQVESMISIVKTLLIIARSENAKNNSEFVFNFSSLLNKEIQNYFSNSHLNSNFILNTKIEDELYIRGEREKFSMVLHNLFSNAKKFSIEILDISIEAYKSNNNIILKVADKGIGIDDADKSKVFNKFYRTQKAEQLGINGFGLGLNLVKNIVEEAAGKIEILDNVPCGTIVKITLPAIELSD